MNSAVAALLLSALTSIAIIPRPFRFPEVFWALCGAVAVVAFGLLSIPATVTAIEAGNDVYLFLAGMMLLAEVARREGLFDWLATYAVNVSKGSTLRLFGILYFAGTIVTTFLSNDATAVVLTPAVFAATRKAKVEALPLLFICAFVANAASFFLPISNPANLVVFGDRMPALADWLIRLGAPSVVATIVTFFALRWTQRKALDSSCDCSLEQPQLSIGGWTALAGIVVTAVLLLTASTFARPLGLPTAVLGLMTLLIVTATSKRAPWPLLRAIHWSILPLVAALFVIVAALEHTAILPTLAAWLGRAGAASGDLTALSAGSIAALLCNVMNNLPVGLISRSVLHLSQASPKVADAVLIGVDLGPNLAVSGSLATLLWLASIRRDGQSVDFWAFLKVGALVMPPALLLALAARFVL